MATTSDYLTQLQADKETLVSKLTEKGVEASNNETFTELVPKVGDIQRGGDIDEYFFENDSTFGNFYTMNSQANAQMFIKKFPPTIISTTNVAWLFYNCKKLVDASQITFANQNIRDMSKLFSNCEKLINIPQLNTVEITTFTNMFENCKSLITLPEFNMSNCNSGAGTIVNKCNSLINLGGFLNLGKNYTLVKLSNSSSASLDIHWAKDLTHESLMNVINKLYDLNLTYDVANGGTLYTQQLILGSTNVAKLTAEEIAIATNKGWSVS